MISRYPSDFHNRCKSLQFDSSYHSGASLDGVRFATIGGPVALVRGFAHGAQAFSHIALVNAAFDLEDGEGMRERSRRHGKN